MAKKQPVSIFEQKLLSQFGIAQEISIPVTRLKLHTYKPIKTPKGRPQFTCTLCSNTYTSSPNLKFHMNTHNGEKPYKCPYCPYSAAYSSNLHRHIKVSHHVENTQNTNHKLHYNPPKKRFKCSQCSHRTTCAQYLQRHVQRRHEHVKQYKCELCDYSSVTNFEIKSHMRTHTGEKTHDCAFCSYRCTTMGVLNLHMRTHTGEKPYKCSQCNFRATCSSGLQSHVTTWHRDIKTDKVVVKPKLNFLESEEFCTTLPTNLKAHSFVPNKSFTCNQCDFSTVTNPRLKMHMRTHTGEKPYGCALCSFASATTGGLNRHIRAHTGEKPYNCEQCYFRASTQSDLRQHCKIHDPGKQPKPRPVM